MGRTNDAYRLYMASPEWAARRKAKLAEAGYRCERCKARDELEVHHLSYERFGNEQPHELQVLCRSCHAAHGEHWDVLPISDNAPARALTAAVVRAADTDRSMRAGITRMRITIELAQRGAEYLDPQIVRDLHAMRRRLKRMEKSYRTTCERGKSQKEAAP